MKSAKTNQSRPKVLTDDSFLEAFRGLGGNFTSTVKNNLKAGSQELKDFLFPFPKPGDDEDEDNVRLPSLENKYRSQVRRIEVVHHEEKILFTRQQRETQQQVQGLQAEIQKLAKSMSDLAGEARQAEVTAMSESPLVGTYHLNFFEQLRKVLARLRSQIQESSMWLASWNKKSQKKNGYWNQFKKKGSSFLLSSDRNVATQAG